MIALENVSKIGLGLAALGRPGYINLGHAEDLAYDYVVEAMERRTHRMLDLAYQLGVRYFDAARSYGRAEQFLKSWLEEHPDVDVVVGSKWGYTYTADWKIEAERHEIKEHSLAVLQKQWELSKALLPHLQLYQIHSATLESGVLENTEALSQLAQLKSEGIKIGLSLSGVNQSIVLEKALLVRVDGVHLFDSAQITFNILEQSVAPMLKMAKESGFHIIIKEALANGRLTPRNTHPDFQVVKGILENIARKYEVGMDAIALAFVLAQDWVDIVLSGAAKAVHLESNLQALNIKLSDDEMNQLEELSVTKEKYWNERSGLKWN
ncbi:MAG: aldo/keto reductase [Bacteroidota bacterium]